MHLEFFFFFVLINADGVLQAFASLLAMAEAREKHPEFCIPMTMIPATISNNVPGTDFTLGADTALNAIADVSTAVTRVNV
jgi:6-phosphofructokinase 1